MQVQAGELRGQSLGGPIEVELNGTRLMLEDLTTTRRPIRINAIGGSVTLGGVRTETRIDGRDTRIDVTVDQPAPVAIYSEGEEPMEVTLPGRRLPARRARNRRPPDACPKDCSR